MSSVIHNPDQYMVDLRQILAQGRKRIGLLIGAGAPLSIRDDNDKPLIPDVAGLTEQVLKKFNNEDKKIFELIKPDLSDKPNIEEILSKISAMSDVLGSNAIADISGEKFKCLAKKICDEIGEVVKAELPLGPSPYTELVSWIGGTNRSHAIEIFTPNYDLLFEDAFERALFPYFDGFTGAKNAFFDPSTISNNDLPPRWTRLWKLHGSIGWALDANNSFIRTGDSNTSELIYPEHRKYDRTQKLPYTALFDRLKNFLLTPDSLLMTCGFSFFDSHIHTVIQESLISNPAASVFAFQHNDLENESYVSSLANKIPNLSVYARNSAIINCIPGKWQCGKLPNKEWKTIRSTYWGNLKGDAKQGFLLGSFDHFAKFFALSKANKITQAWDKVVAEQGIDEEPIADNDEEGK